MTTDVLVLEREKLSVYKNMDPEEKMLAKAKDLSKQGTRVFHIISIGDGALDTKTNLATVKSLVAKGKLLSKETGWSLPGTGGFK